MLVYKYYFIIFQIDSIIFYGRSSNHDSYIESSASSDVDFTPDMSQDHESEDSISTDP